MRTMVVTAFGGPEVLELREVPDPTPRPGEALIEVEVAPVLFIDAQLRSGWGRDWFATDPPYVPGQGVAGTVQRVGSEDATAWVGRRVVADTPETGGYRSHAVVPVDRLVPVPEAVPLDLAAALLHDGRTALQLLDVVAPAAREWVPVTGAAGGMGQLLVQGATRAGARVIASAGDRAKRDVAVKAGAEITVDHRDPGWVDAVLGATHGEGVAVVLDGVGGTTGTAAVGAAAPGARFSAHGAPSGAFARPDPAIVRRKGITLTGIETVQFGPAERVLMTERALAAAAAGQLEPGLAEPFPLEAAAGAHRALEGRSVIGKIGLEVR